MHPVKIKHLVARPIKSAVALDKRTARPVEVFCCVDLIKASVGCTTATARGIAWRIFLQEHFSSEDIDEGGILEVHQGEHREPFLALDALRSFELLCLLPHCQQARALRRSAILTYARFEDPPRSESTLARAAPARKHSWRRLLLVASLAALGNVSILWLHAPPYSLTSPSFSRMTGPVKP